MHRNCRFKKRALRIGKNFYHLIADAATKEIWYVGVELHFTAEDSLLCLIAGCL